MTNIIFFSVFISLSVIFYGCLSSGTDETSTNGGSQSLYDSIVTQDSLQFIEDSLKLNENVFDGVQVLLNKELSTVTEILKQGNTWVYGSNSTVSNGNLPSDQNYNEDTTPTEEETQTQTESIFEFDRGN